MPRPFSPSTPRTRYQVLNSPFISFVNQIRGHIAGSSPPSPVRFAPCIFVAGRVQPVLLFVQSSSSRLTTYSTLGLTLLHSSVRLCTAAASYQYQYQVSYRLYHMYHMYHTFGWVGVGVTVQSSSDPPLLSSFSCFFPSFFFLVSFLSLPFVFCFLSFNVSGLLACVCCACRFQYRWHGIVLYTPLTALRRTVFTGATGIEIRTHDGPKNPYIPGFLQTIFGSHYYLPPQ